MERRYSYLLIMLSCCLSWQEQSAEAVLAVGDSATMKSAKKHYDTAIAKILFLEHALVHCLTTDRAQSVLRRLRGLLPVDGHRDSQGNHGHLDLEIMVRDDSCYFAARVFAKFFHAALESRKIKWTSQKGRVNLALAFRYRPEFRNAVFMIGDVPRKYQERDIMAARNLARSLVRCTDHVASMIENLEDVSEVRAFGAAVKCHLPGRVSKRNLQANATAAEAGAQSDSSRLLEIWNAASPVMIKHLLSRLLERASDCDFLKYCLEYDEFHHHKTFHHQMHEELGGATTGNCEEIAKIASAKLSHLQGVEKGCAGREKHGDGETREQWRRVCRKWISRGFRRCIYTWHGINVRTSREKVDLHKEVEDVIRYIATGRWLGVVENLLGFSGYARTAVRMATAGYDIDEIQERTKPWGKKKLYTLLYRASTKREGRRLHECWSSLDG